MLNRALVLTAVVCCALTSASFMLFALDQVSGASKRQQNELASSAVPTAATKPVVHHRTAEPRRFIDDAAAKLTSPFRSIVQTDSDWVHRGSQTLFALLVYGLGLGYLARFSRGMS